MERACREDVVVVETTSGRVDGARRELGAGGAVGRLDGRSGCRWLGAVVVVAVVVVGVGSRGGGEVLDERSRG
jgi:hypothetical protein